MKSKKDKLSKYCPKFIIDIFSKLDSNDDKYLKWNYIKVLKFLNTYSYEDLYSKKDSKEIISITQGEYDYTYFNICFLNDVLKNIIYVLAKGAVPFVDIRSKDDEKNIWECFFKQPFVSSEQIKLKEFKNLDKNIVASNSIKPGFKSIYDNNELDLWCKAYNNFVVFNDDTKKYILNEYNTILKKDMRVLGVLCRGTDYVTLKPKNHPIQPTVKEVIDLAHKKIKEFNLEYIYLATDEKAIEEKFRKEFPGKILINKRTYYDEQYYNNEDITLIGQVKFNRENDDYYKGLEYLSSLYILSKCNVLIGGNCGGSCAALYMNNGKYEDWDIFNLGLYGVDDIN